VNVGSEVSKGGQMSWSPKSQLGAPPNSLTLDEVTFLKELERKNRDRGASEYVSRTRSVRGTFQMHAEEQTLLYYISPRRPERVLDGGAGVGRLAVLVAPKVADLVCLDISAVSLDLLASEAKARGLFNIELVCGDLCSMDTSIGQFDKVYSVEAIQHIPSHRARLAAVRRMYDVLRPGGQCVMMTTCWNGRNWIEGLPKEGFWGEGERKLYMYYFSPREFRSLIREAGFVDVRIRGLIVLPRKITRLLPISFGFVELWSSLVPALAGASTYIIAIGRKTELAVKIT